MATLMRTTVLKSLGGAHAAVCTVVPSRGIYGRELRKSKPAGFKRPPPFDYVNKDYTMIRSVFDRTTHRIDENSKVVVVEGPIAVGKTEFAKALADELGMRHYPEANLDNFYIRPNGVNLRDFDSQVPVDTRTFDHTNFCLAPTHRLAANFQLMTYRERYSQYLDALIHVLNTGQGVVLERCPYSDFVFMEAMLASKYASKGAGSVYYDIRNNTLDDLMRPHLVIYLDISVDTVKPRVRERNLPHEVKSPALASTDYLKMIEYQYKHKYLRDISTHAELLVYDWSGKGEIDVIVEDIERLDFEKYTERTEPKMKDWRLPREMDWAEKRMIYTNGKSNLMNNMNVARCDVPELITSAEDSFEWDKIVFSHPKMEYLQGYCKGEGSTIFKNSYPKYSEFL